MSYNASTPLTGSTATPPADARPYLVVDARVPGLSLRIDGLIARPPANEPDPLGWCYNAEEEDIRAVVMDAIETAMDGARVLFEPFRDGEDRRTRVSLELDVAEPEEADIDIVAGPVPPDTDSRNDGVTDDGADGDGDRTAEFVQAWLRAWIAARPGREVTIDAGDGRDGWTCALTQSMRVLATGAGDGWVIAASQAIDTWCRYEGDRS